MIFYASFSSFNSLSLFSFQSFWFLHKSDESCDLCFFCLQLYFQIEPEEDTSLIKLKAVTDLFDEFVEEPLFNQLRYNETVLSCMTTC